ncbi:transporter substrate-binding domain-containing protein [Clostridiaceae bacterium M8S5]|nr:transporter substrate-binding domain-containing protein [Clostridiaceae bacterium M8S5]
MKKLTILLIIIMIAIGAIGCNKKEISKIDEIKEKGKLVLGTSASFPPYEFHKEINGKDEIIGFDIEIAKAIADELGVKLEIKDMDFGGLLGAMKADKIDIIVAGMTPTDERKKNVDFSKIYYTSKQCLIINNKDIDNIKTIEDVKNRTICVQKGSIQEEIAFKITDKENIKSLGKLSNVVMELLNGKVDAVIVGEPVAKSYVKKNPNLCIAEVEVKTDNNGSAIAINKGNKELLKVINDTLEKLKEDDKINEFVVKYTKIADEK